MKSKTLLLGLLSVFTLFVTSTSFAQAKKEAKETQAVVIQSTTGTIVSQEDPNAIFTEVETKPEFPGGTEAFTKFVYANFKAQIKVDIDTSVLTSFIVEKDGTLTDIKIIRDPGFRIGKEVLKILKKSPKWKPGLVEGNPVRTLYNLPVRIKTR